MSSPRVSGRMAPPWVLLSVLLFAGGAEAQEASTLMREPIGYTSVADAFEEGDPFDIDVHLGFRRSRSTGSIQREIIDLESQDGRSSRHFIEVARHEHVRNDLLLQLDVGVFRDLMLFVRFPLVLADDRELRPLPGRACASSATFENCRALLEPQSSGPDQPLFALPRQLKSQRRSGLPRIDLGVAWGVINQYRQRHLATWVLIAEGSIDTGDVISPCIDASCNPGLTSGTAFLRLESRWSYRYRAFEPFLGIAHRFQWVTGAEKLYFPEGELEGAVDPDPPQRSEATLGVAVIPWEDRGRFQRFEIDLSGTAAFESAGRSVTPLFDALGTSDHEQIVAPNYERLHDGSEPGPPAILFTGLTNVEAHAELAFDAQLVMQAARYVRFALGVGVSYLTPHLITGAQACNRSVERSLGDPRAGSCEQGIINPNYRPVIDAPGKRFRLDGDVTLRLSAAATGQF